MALKNIFLHQFHKDHNAKFIPFADYEMPINYEFGIIKEHKHVRNSVGIFDVSHMGQILITISDSNIHSLEKYIPLNLKKLKINKSYYSFLINENGGIIDDLIISKILSEGNEFFYIVYNSSRKIIDEKIFKNCLSKFIFLDKNSLIAVQGPKSEIVLKFFNIPKDFYFMSSMVITYCDHLIIISRSGYTGEDGFEISIPNEIVLKFINKLMKNKDVMLCGLGARDTLRLESGLSLYGNELNENITPIESGLTSFIHKERLNDQCLNGSKILKNQLEDGTNLKKIGLMTKSKSILRANMKLIDINKNEIGYITSGSFSPILNKSIAIGYFNSKLISDNKFYSLLRGKIEEINLVKLPFILQNYKKGPKL